MRWIDQPPNVRCMSCGLLARLDPELEVSDVPLRTRAEAGVFWDHGIPHCAVGRLAPTAQFEALLKKYGEPGPAAIETLAFIRMCEDWTPFMAGLSLADHLRERQMYRLEEQRREWERVQQDFAQATQQQINRIFIRLGLLQVAIGVIAIIVTILVAT